jgi:hypothetical protein
MSSSRKINSGAVANRAAAFSAAEGPGPETRVVRTSGNSSATASTLPSVQRSKHTMTSNGGPLFR